MNDEPSEDEQDDISEDEPIGESTFQSRITLYVVILVCGYASIRGWGSFWTAQCGLGQLTVVSLVLVTLIMLAPLLYVVTALYYLLIGQTTKLTDTIDEAKMGLVKSYRRAPTLTVLAVIAFAANLYSLAFRYHTYNRAYGHYVYDRLLHQGTYVRNDCPDDNSDDD